ncbi:hypothetical protein M9H77_30155 [Catharanthus roseus]|uniref:Uncharacterized protein n=1 Tax=Catharanthus roseus TaxID=4058 RepID=A0ACB9ZYR4_CATRO|nr:hypothetical protein M9H77_30155 [Catharanthus roseus]
MFCSVTFDLDPVDRGHSTVRGLGPRRDYFLAGSVRRGPPARVAQGGLVKYQIVALQAELARTNRHFHLSRQARQFETARANGLAAEVAQIRGTPVVQGCDTSLQRRVETISRSANETPAEAEACWRNYSRLWDVTCKL